MTRRPIDQTQLSTVLQTNAFETTALQTSYLPETCLQLSGFVHYNILLFMESIVDNIISIQKDILKTLNIED